MKGYLALIVTCTDCAPDEAPAILQLMRDANGGTLDHLSRSRFARAARDAHNAFQRWRQA